MTAVSTALQVLEEMLSQNTVLNERGLTRTEAEQILECVLGLQNRSELYLKKELRLDEHQMDRVQKMAEKRASGTPLQHLTGYQDFLDHRYFVNPDVLVPRPETELLVQSVQEHFKSSPPLRGLEIGLGSGVISIELLSSFPQLEMTATDVSAAAISVAQKNAEQILGRTDHARLKPIQCSGGEDVFEALGSPVQPPFDFIVSNPPYLLQEDPLDEDVARHEPSAALFPINGNALYFYEKIASEGWSFLGKSGVCFVEVPSQRCDSIQSCFEVSGWRVRVIEDLAGRRRLIQASAE